MADRATREQTTSEIDPAKDRYAAGVDEPTAQANDPGGAHAKGFSAEPGAAPTVNDQGPLPVAQAPDPPLPIRQPERDGKVVPTGRADQRGYVPNDRLTGADR